ncbi:MAG: DUF4367 domain-containing protein [Oscillospiraceae bacterium]|nr:DUF4367 domain-containing protein [Oscillospiraceae bacterium]
MNVWASILIILVVLIRAIILHKIPKLTFIIMWGMCLLRLLAPFRFSIYTNSRSTEIIIARVLNNVASVLTSSVQKSEAGAVSYIPNISWPIFIWIVIAATLFIYFIVIHLRCRNVYRFAVPIENAYVNEWLSMNKLKWRTVKIKVSADISASLTYGLFRPVILIPKTTDWENRDLLKYILTHEMIHIQQFGTLWKLLLLIVACVHWFNPFVWVMYILANRDLEILCDEEVVRTFGVDSRAAYALALIDLIEKREKITPISSAFSRNAIEERIISIMSMKKSSFKGIAFAFLLVVGITTVYFTSAFSANVEIAIGTDVFVLERLSATQLAKHNVDNQTITTYRIINRIESASESISGRFLQFTTLDEANRFAPFTIKAPSFLPGSLINMSIGVTQRSDATAGYEALIRYSLKILNDPDWECWINMSMDYVGPDAYIEVETGYSIRALMINDIEAIATYSHTIDGKSLFWIKDGVFYCLSASLDWDIMIAIAESV